MAHSSELTNRILTTVRSVIETDIIPALAEHEGSCKLIEVFLHSKVVVVVIDYQGKCIDCDINNRTLEMMKNLLIEELRTTCNWKGRVNVISHNLYKELMEETSELRFRD